MNNAKKKRVLIDLASMLERASTSDGAAAVVMMGGDASPAQPEDQRAEQRERDKRDTQMILVFGGQAFSSIEGLAHPFARSHVNPSR